MRLKSLLILLTAVLLAQPAGAQSLRFSVAGPTAFTGQLALVDFPLTNGRGSVGLHFASAPGLSVHLRNTTTFGPLGNVIVDLDAAAAADGRFSAALAARGALGPVAVRLRLHAANTDLLPLLRSRDGSLAAIAPSRESLLWGVQAGGTWRLSRELLLVFEPAWIAGSQGGALLLPFELQLPRFRDGNDLRLRVSTMLPLGEPAAFNSAWSAAGAGLRIDRGRQAAWDVWLMLGGNAGLLSPGLAFGVQESLAGGLLRVSVRAEPWRSDLPLVDIESVWSRPFGDSVLEASLALGLPAPGLVTGLAWSLPLD